MANSTSDFASEANLENPYDPRIWYMPCMRGTTTYATMEVARNVPTPLLEPVCAAAALRVSPMQAIASQLVAYSAARGRPLMLLALGDPGSGLAATEEWVKGSVVPTTGARQYNEMLTMLTAMNALGPAHQIIGACVSLGANDLTGAVYSNFTTAATTFIANVRTDTGLPNLPIVWAQCAADYEQGTPGDGYLSLTGLPFRVGRMRTAQASLDKDSGVAGAATPWVKTVVSPGGNGFGAPVPDVNGWVSEVHFNAAGMYINGRAMGQALLSML